MFLFERFYRATIFWGAVFLLDLMSDVFAGGAIFCLRGALLGLQRK